MTETYSIAGFRNYHTPNFIDVADDLIDKLFGFSIKYCYNMPTAITDTLTLSWRDEALYNLVAHELIMNKTLYAGTATLPDTGAISIKVADLAESRGVNLVSKQWEKPWYRTVYGQRYLYIKRLCGIPAIAVGI